MRIIEIVSAVLAERLMDNGTQFAMDPDQIIWSDGKITKVQTPQKKGRGRGKKVPPTSKNGVFRKIVQNFGPKGVSAGVVTNEVEVIVPQPESNKGNETAPATPSASASNTASGTAIQKKRPWQFDEQTDLLLLYKTMLLGGLQKDNFKELSRRMNEIGWNRNNDQCRQQVPCYVYLFTIPSINKFLMNGIMNSELLAFNLFPRFICCKIVLTK